MRIKGSLFWVSAIFLCVSNLCSYPKPLLTTDALDRKLGSSKPQEEKEEEYEVYLLKKRGREPFEAVRDFRRKIRAKKEKEGSNEKREDKDVRKDLYSMTVDLHP